MIDVHGDIQHLLYSSGYAGSVKVDVSGTNVSVSASQGDTTIVQPSSKLPDSASSSTPPSFLDLSPEGQAVSKLEVALALIVPSTENNNQKHSANSETSQKNSNTDQSSTDPASSNAIASSSTVDLVSTVQSIVQNFIQEQIQNPSASIHTELDGLPGGAENWMASQLGTTANETNTTISEFGTQWYQNAQQAVSSFATAYSSGAYTVQSVFQMPEADYHYQDEYAATSMTGTGFDPNSTFVNWAQQQDVANGTYSTVVGTAYVTWADPNAAAQAASGFNLLV